MYCEIVYIIEENNSLKRRANLKPRGYNRFRNDPETFSTHYAYFSNGMWNLI